MQLRNLVTLVFCQLISATGSIVVVTLGGIIGGGLAPSPSLATLPLSAMVVAIALTTVPATALMRRIGRRRGFALASASAMFAIGLVVTALYQQNFVLFLIAVGLFGMNMAFTQQYRYAAAECVPPEYVPRAVSLVLVGSIGAAFLGKELVTRGQFWIDGVAYAGTMVALLGLFALQILLFLSMGVLGHDVAGEPERAGRSAGQLMRQPVFAAAVLGGVAGYGLMTLIMTATPISMHVNEGFSLERTANVIKYHVLGMYVPSLFVGFLIERIGVTRLMLGGVAGMLLTSVIALQGHAYLHYWWALVMLGVGWNFLYVGGTTMLTYTYRREERFRAQAVNEFLVFGTAAAASLLAGTIMHWFGWTTLLTIPVPLLLGVAVLLIATRKDPQLQRKRVLHGS